MKKVYSLLISTLLLSACGSGGGGGGEDEDSNNTSSISSANASIIGKTWASENCINTGLDTSEGRILSFSIKDGFQIFVKVRVDYATSDCSDFPINVIYTGGEVKFTGTQTGSVCIADQFNSTTILATDNVNGENLVTGSEMRFLLLQNQLSEETYDITCLYNEKLYFGLQDVFLDTETSRGRPEEIDFSIPYEVISTSSRMAARGDLSTTSHIKEGMNNVLENLKNNR